MKFCIAKSLKSRGVDGRVSGNEFNNWFSDICQNIPALSFFGFGFLG